MEHSTPNPDAIGRILSRMNEQGGDYHEWFIGAINRDVSIGGRHNIDSLDPTLVVCDCQSMKDALNIVWAFQLMGCASEISNTLTAKQIVVYAFRQDAFSRPSLMARPN